MYYEVIHPVLLLKCVNLCFKNNDYIGETWQALKQVYHLTSSVYHWDSL